MPAVCCARSGLAASRKLPEERRIRGNMREESSVEMLGSFSGIIFSYYANPQTMPTRD